MPFNYRTIVSLVSFILLIAVLSREVRAQDFNLPPNGDPVATTLSQNETLVVSRSSRWYGVSIVVMVGLGIGIWFLWNKSNKQQGGGKT